MSMRLNEASEILDDRLDEFTDLFEKQYPDATFGSAAAQSTSEIVAVGRIASDSLEGKLNVASLVLETSRRTGAGLRVPLKVDALPSVQFFPGQIVALRGINASGDYFSVKEVLPLSLLPTAASSPNTLETINERLGGVDVDQPLSIFYAAGPYTADDNLDFEPLQELCKKAAEEYADALLLLGPFIDLEHPLIATGDFDLPDIPGLDPETATLTTLFRHCISKPLHQLCAAVPSITIMLMPSVRDAVSKHVSWPQEQLPKKELGLPRQARVVSNPVTLSLNESVIGMCSHDVLYDLRKEEVLGGRPAEANLLTRLPRYIVEQRHFAPMFPPSSRETLPKSGGPDSMLPIGGMVDVSYLKLGDWWNVRPDILITPSILPPFVKVSALPRFSSCPIITLSVRSSKVSSSSTQGLCLSVEPPILMPTWLCILEAYLTRSDKKSSLVTRCLRGLELILCAYSHFPGLHLSCNGHGVRGIAMYELDLESCMD